MLKRMSACASSSIIILHGWIPRRGKAQVACNLVPMRTVFYIIKNLERKSYSDEKTVPVASAPAPASASAF